MAVQNLHKNTLIRCATKHIPGTVVSGENVLLCFVSLLTTVPQQNYPPIVNISFQGWTIWFMFCTFTVNGSPKSGLAKCLYDTGCLRWISIIVHGFILTISLKHYSRHYMSITCCTYSNSQDFLHPWHFLFTLIRREPAKSQEFADSAKEATWTSSRDGLEGGKAAIFFAHTVDGWNPAPPGMYKIH